MSPDDDRKAALERLARLKCLPHARRAGESVSPPRCWAHLDPKDESSHYPGGRCSMPADGAYVVPLSLNERYELGDSRPRVPLCRTHLRPAGPAWMKREFAADRARAVEAYRNAVTLHEAELNAILSPRALCPGCGCRSGAPCKLAWDGNEAYCVPAGELPGYSVCSACLTPNLRFVPPHPGEVHGLHRR